MTSTRASGSGLRAPGPLTVTLAICLGLSMGVYLVVYGMDWLTPLGPLRNLAATLAATLPLALAVWAGQDRTQPARRDLFLMLGGALALRLCIPLELLDSSDDAYRYLWDGLVLDSGINPFAHAPGAPQLAHLRDTVFFPHVYRPDMRTVYPPLAELWFWVSYRIDPGGFVGWKLVLLGHECASVTLLLLLLRRLQLPPLRTLVYAWSPLAVTQLFVGAHLDGLLVPWCLLSLHLARRRPGWAAAALAASAMVRPLMLLCLPALAARRPLRQTLLVGLVFSVVFALGLAPFATAGAGLVESLLVYAEHWRFNGSLFLLLDDTLGYRPWLRPAVYATIAAACLGTAWLPLSRPARYLLALGSYLALAPTVYPWYLLAMAALASLYPGPLAVLLPLLLGLSDLVFVGHAPGGPWKVPALAHWLEYLLLYGLLLVPLARHLGARLRRRGSAVPKAEHGIQSRERGSQRG